MANTVIQLKFSTNTATPPSLNIAEPAYSYTSNTLFIGAPTGRGVIPIGGKLYLDQQQTIYDQVNAAFSAANTGAGVVGAYNQANAAFAEANSKPDYTIIRQPFYSKASDIRLSANAFIGNTSVSVQTVVAGQQVGTYLQYDDHISFDDTDTIFTVLSVANPTAQTSLVVLNKPLDANAFSANTVIYGILGNQYGTVTELVIDGGLQFSLGGGRTANTAILQTNDIVATGAFRQANAAFDTANAAFAAANNVTPQVQPIFNTANAAFIHANNSYNTANLAYSQANTANTIARSAFDSSNTKITSVIASTRLIVSGATLNQTTTIDNTAFTANVGSGNMVGNYLATGNRVKIGNTEYTITDVFSPSSSVSSVTINGSITEVVSAGAIIYKYASYGNVTNIVVDAGLSIDSVGNNTVVLSSNTAVAAFDRANAAFNRANTSSLSVSLVDDANVFSNNITQVTGLRFDANSGFDVTDLGSGNVKIAMNSTFKFWKIAGQQDLIANGLDTIAFVGSNGVSIRSNTLSNPKSIIFDTKSLFDVTNAAFNKANSAAIAANTDKTRLTSIDLKQYVQVDNNNISFGTDYSSGGIPSGLTNWNGQGGWNEYLYTNLPTTGGTGTGLTVNVAAGGGGYITIDLITIHTPGTGYTNGDEITINNENDLPGTLTLVVEDNTKLWTLDKVGVTTFPGGATISNNSVITANSFVGAHSFPDNTIQNTAFQGYGTDNVARNTANASFIWANAAYNQANTNKANLVNSGFTAQLHSNGAFALPGNLIFGPSKGRITNEGDGLLLIRANGQSGNTGVYLDNAGQAVLYGKTSVLIQTNQGLFDSPTKSFTFNQDGTFTFPDTTKQSTAFTGYGTDNVARDTANASFIWANAAYDQANTKVSKSGDTMTGDLKFGGGGGILNLPTNQIAITANVDNDASGFIAQATGVSTVYANTDVIIQANTGGATFSQWNFNRDGTLTFPDSTIQSTAFQGYGVDDVARYTANSAAIAANTPSHVANSGFIQANAAYIRANNSLNANTGGTVTGNLVVVGNVVATVITTSGASGNITGADNIYANTFYAKNVDLFTFVNAAFAVANSAAAGSVDQTARNTANAASIRANNSLDANNGGTISGNVTFASNVVVQGNFTVLGSATTLNTSSITVSDTLIYLGGNNYTSDAVDIGIIGNYNDGTNAHAGIIRDPNLKEWLFFKGYTPEVESNNLIDIGHASFAYANVRAGIFKGNVEANSVSILGYNILDYANAAFAAANNVTPQVQPAFNTANAAFIRANNTINANTGGTVTGNLVVVGNVVATAIITSGSGTGDITGANNIYANAVYASNVDLFTFANAAFNTANSAAAGSVDQTARNTSNASFIQANNAWNTANAAYAAANNVTPQVQPAFNTANAAFTRANNTINANTGGTITGNLVVVGNVVATVITTSGVSGNITGADNIYANTFYAKNVDVLTYINAAFNTANSAAAGSVDQSARNTANASFIHANAAFAAANAASAGSIDQYARNTANAASANTLSLAGINSGSTAYGYYFDGSTNGVRLPTDSNLAFGSGDFTIEFWMKAGSSQTTYATIMDATSDNTGTGIGVGYNGSGTPSKLNFFGQGGVSSTLSSTTTVTNNVWYHIACVKSGSNGYLFVNGTLEASTSGWSGITAATMSGGQIGRSRYGSGNAGDNTYTGLLSNIRILKGTALYTSSFTSPTISPTTIANTQLLVASSTFVDTSNNAFTLTAVDTTPTGSSSDAPFSLTIVGTAVDTFARNQVNAAFAVANSAAAASIDQTARNTANAAFAAANTGTGATGAYNTANAAFIAANNSTGTNLTQNNSIIAAFNTANAAFAVANSAAAGSVDQTSRNTANAAYTRANNTINANTGGTITGNLVVVGNVVATLISTSGSGTGDITGANNIFANTFTTYGASGNITGVNNIYANTFYAKNVDVLSYINAAFAVANSASAGSVDQTARNTANAAFTAANTGTGATGAYNQANAAFIAANNSTGTNLTQNNSIIAAFNTANAAFNIANVAYANTLSLAGILTSTNSSFTTPTTAPTAIANTQLLIASSTVIDTSNNAFTLTNVSVIPPVSTSDVPFGGAYSYYFNGSTNGLGLPTSNNLNFGSGDFTFEFWMKANTTQRTFATVMDSAQSGVGIGVGIANSGPQPGKINFFGGQSASPTLSGTTTVTNNVWYHIACVKSGSNGYVFVNGVLEASTSAWSGNTVSSFSDGRIGRSRYGSGNDIDNAYTGFLANIRFIKGTALYVANTSNVVIGTAVDTFARNQVNAAFAIANSAASGSVDQTARNTANAAFTAANTGTGAAGAYDTANAAFTRANNSINANTGGTVTGNLVVVGNVVATIISTSGSGTGDITGANNIYANTFYAKNVDVLSYINAAFNTANSAASGSVDQTARNTANASFIIANSAAIAANTPSSVANNAWNTANAAFIRANNSINANTGGTITGNLVVVGNVVATVITTSGVSGNITGADNIYANTLYAKNVDVLTYINAAFNTANSAASGSVDQTARNTANAAFTAANSSSGSAGAYNQANAAFDTANAAFLAANNASATSAVGAYNHANAAFATANSASVYANGAFSTANSAASAASSAASAASSAQGTADAALSAAGAAQNSADAAYTRANNALNANTGGTITGDLSITGNFSVLGNTFSINAGSIVANDSLIVLGAGNYTSDILDIGLAGHYNDGTNAHTGLIRDSVNKEWYLFKGYTQEINANNNIVVTHPSFRIDTLNANLRSSNVIINSINILPYINSAFNTGNAAFIRANAASNHANAAFNAANAASGVAAAFNTANAAFNVANSASANTLSLAGILTGAGGGVTSYYFNGSSQGIRLPTTSNLDFGSGDFTIEFWMNAGNSQQPYAMIADALTVNDKTGIGVNQNDGGTLGYLRFRAQSGYAVLATTTFVLDNTWRHIACVKSGSNGYLFVNGTLEASTSAWSGVTDASLSDGQIGRSRYGGGTSSDNTYTGYISNFRILKGTALYTSGFTAPAFTLNAITNTQLLISSGTTVSDSSNNALTFTAQTVLPNSSTTIVPSITANGASNGSIVGTAVDTFARNQANAAFTAANTGAGATGAYNTANAAFLHANAAFNAANSSSGSAGAYNTANAAFTRANNSINANTGGTITGNLVVVGNVVATMITTSGASGNITGADNIYANTLYAKNIDVLSYINAAFNVANSGGGASSDTFARNQANAAFITANAAFIAANNSAGTDLTQNNSITAAFNHANAAFIAANTGGSAVDQLARNTANAAFITGNVAVNQANAAFDVANSAAIAANTPSHVANSAGVYANGAFVQANAAFASLNANVILIAGVDTSQNISITAAFNTGNSAFIAANSAGVYANGAFIQANNAWTTGNYAFNHANSGFIQANAAYIHVNASFNHANSGFTQANSAFHHANSAFDTANSKAYIFYQDTAPATSNAHDLWVNSDTGTTYENYGTPSSPIWAEFGPTNSVANTPPATQTYATLNITSALVFSSNQSQVIAYQGYGVDNLARSVANSTAIRANNSLNANNGGTVTANVVVVGNVHANLFITNGSGGDISNANTVFSNTVSTGNVTVSTLITAANVVINNNITTKANSTVLGNSSVSGILTVGGNAIISGSANITGSLNVSSNLFISGISAGYAPNRPAFRITGNGGSIVATSTVAGGFMVVDYNQGNYLNTTTGIFTAPIPGLYQVNLTVRTFNNTNATINQAIIYKNANPIIMIEFGVNTTMNHTGGSTVIKLAAGDTLKFDVAVGQISFDGNDNWSVAYIG